ncbi:hypothetical protein Bbelb_175570, partial [Branchiostoma belcheri]
MKYSCTILLATGWRSRLLIVRAIPYQGAPFLYRTSFDVVVAEEKEEKKNIGEGLVCTTIVLVNGQFGPGPGPAPDGSGDPSPSQQPNGTNTCRDHPDICRYRQELKAWQDRQVDNGTGICPRDRLLFAPMRFCAGLGGCVVGADCQHWTGLKCLPNTVFCPAANMCIPTSIASSCNNGTIVCSEEEDSYFAYAASTSHLNQADCIACGRSECRKTLGTLRCRQDEIAYCPTLRQCIPANDSCEGFSSLGASPQPPTELPTDEPRTEESRGEEPQTEDPRMEEARTEEPLGGKPRTEEPPMEEPRTEAPRTEGPQTERPPMEGGRTEGPPMEGGRTEGPPMEGPRTEELRGEERRTEGPRMEGPRTEEPPMEGPRTEGPRGEERRTEEPPMEERRTEEPRGEERRTEGPRGEERRTEEPPMEERRTEGPRGEERRTEEPLMEEQRTEEPPMEERRTEEPPMEERRTEEPPMEERRTEGPRGEERRTEEPLMEEQRTEGPRGEERRTEGPRGEERRTEGPRGEERRTEEPPMEGPRTEGPRMEGPRTEEPRGEEPWTEDPHNNCTMVFCAERGRCVPRDGSCHGDGKGVTCLPGQAFNLEAGKCVWAEKKGGVTCGNGEVFNAAFGTCVSATLLVNTETYTCEVGEVFSADVGSCVPDRAFLPDDTWTASCGPGQAFNLEVERCVPATPLAQDNIGAISCPQGQVFNLEVERCVPETPRAQDNTGAISCPQGQAFNLEVERCVPATPRAQDNIGAISCPQGQSFCLQTGRCVPDDCTTATVNKKSAVICSENEIFFMPENRCVRLMPTASTNDDKITCRENEVFDMQGGRCTPVPGKLTAASKEGTVTCSKNEFFSLASGGCVPRDPVMSSGHVPCAVGEVYCLSAGRCMPASGDCNAGGRRPTAEAKPPRGRDDEAEPFVCSGKEVFCLSAGGCVSKTFCLKERQPDPQTACGNNEAFCLSTGFCVRNCSDSRKDPRTEESPGDYAEVSVTPTEGGRPGNKGPGKNGPDAKPGGEENEEKQIECGRREVQVHVPDDGDCTSLCAAPGDEDGPLGIIEKEGGGMFSLQLCYTNKTVRQPSPEAAPAPGSRTPREAGGDRVESRQLKDLFKVCDPTGSDATPPPSKQCLAEPPVLVFRYDTSYALSAAKDRAAKVITKMSGNAPWKDLRISGARLSLNQYIGFQPSSTTRGTVGIDISVQSGDRLGEHRRFTFKVIDNGVNDPPVITVQREYVAPSVPHDLAGWDGFEVAHMMRRFVTDEEQEDVGAAVVLNELPSSEIGVWKVSYSGAPDRFEELVPPTRVTRDASPRVERLALLRPSARVKYVPSAANGHWSFIEARQKTGLTIRAWDATTFDGEQVITYNPTCPASEACGGSNSISREKVQVIIERLGCDGRGGSGATEDSCGVCGGDGTSCQDCNGDVDGSAVYNKCGQCTGGNTGKDISFGLDCAEKCGLFETNELLGKCLPMGTRVAADCAGAFGLVNRAFENECGHCVGGSTRKAADFGKNECGNCDDTLDCVDCEGVVGGGKQEDGCGECLDPSDPNFNKGCISLSGVTPRILKAGAQTTVTVSGSGLQRLVNAKCTITSVGKGTKGELDDVRLSQKNWRDQTFELRFQAPRSAGEFDLSCDLSGRDGTLVTKALDRDNRIIILPSEGIQITSVQPDNTEIGGAAPRTVTVTGQGLVDTGDAWCYARHKRTTIQVPAQIISATEATCSLPPSEKSVRVKIGVTLEKLGDSKGRGTEDYSGAWFEYRAAAPRLDFARFSDNLASVAVVFDKAIEGPRECRGLFDRASVEKFGSAKCRIVNGNTIVAILGKEATLRPGDRITLKEDAITVRMSEAGAAAAGSVEVLAPQTASIPRVELIARPPKVDACTCLKLEARSRNTGGRAVTHRWTVEVDDASVDMTDLEARLSGTTDDRLRLCNDQGLLEQDKRYTFCVSVTNFLSSESETSCDTIETLAEVQPFTAKIAGSRRQKTTADRRLRLQANVMTPPDSCDQDVDSVTNNLNFRWELVGSTDFNLDDFTGTVASIKEGMKGGKTYSVRFIAYSDTYSSEDTVEIAVLSRDLQPAIAGKTITIGSHQNVTLDGSGSRDPDNAEGEGIFTWTCQERDTGLPCWVEVDGEPTPLPLSDLETTNVQGSMLNPNTWYTFTLTMRKGNRSASTSVELFVSPNEVPQVEVDPIPEKVNPDKRVVIQFRLTTTLSDTIVTLECLDQEGYGYVDLEQVTANGLTSRTYRKPAAGQPVNVVILPDSLAPNTRYTFRATAAHQGGEAYADVDVVTNAPPSPGSFQVEPMVGTAVVDTFTLSAEGWTDDEDFALEYRFSYIGPDGRTLLLRERAEDSQLEATLPAGTGDNNTLTLVVEVFDGRRASTKLTVEVTVNPLAEITSDTVDNVKRDFEENIRIGDFDKAISMAISMVTTGGNLSAALQDSINELKDQVTNEITEKEPQDEEEVDNALRSLAGTHQGGDDMREETREKVKAFVNDLVDRFFRVSDELSENNNASDSGQAPRRRKRNVGTNSVTTPMTTDQVSDMLLVFDAMLASIDESSPDAVTTKLDFRSTVELGMVGMCRGQSYGGSASVAMSGNVVVRTDLTLFDDIADRQLLASCDGCSDDITGTAKIRLGEDVAWAYEQWQCVPESSTICYGACIGSAQIKFDPLTDPLSTDVI